MNQISSCFFRTSHFQQLSFLFSASPPAAEGRQMQVTLPGESGDEVRIPRCRFPVSKALTRMSFSFSFLFRWPPSHFLVISPSLAPIHFVIDSVHSRPAPSLHLKSLTHTPSRQGRVSLLAQLSPSLPRCFFFSVALCPALHSFPFCPIFPLLTLLETISVLPPSFRHLPPQMSLNFQPTSPSFRLHLSPPHPRDSGEGTISSFPLVLTPFMSIPPSLHGAPRGGQ